MSEATTTPGQASVGIIANPRAARDVRRLVSGASNVPVSERCAIIQRVMSGLAAVGIGQVLMMYDRDGIAAGLERAVERQTPSSGTAWPKLTFLEMPIEGRPIDTLIATRLMYESGVGTIVVLGGDGTHRLVAHECRQTPLVCLSTGTNNAFPQFSEATLAGLASGAVAGGLVAPDDVCLVNKRLCVNVNGLAEIPALVDVCLTGETHTGTRALWRPEALHELYLAFAEPGTIGLSSIGSLLCPTSRSEDAGLAIELGNLPVTDRHLNAPIAPGLISPVGIKNYRRINLGERCSRTAQAGTLAFDGEREIELFDGDRVEITLDRSGPRSVDVPGTMRILGQQGFLERLRTID